MTPSSRPLHINTFDICTLLHGVCIRLVLEDQAVSMAYIRAISWWGKMKHRHAGPEDPARLGSPKTCPPCWNIRCLNHLDRFTGCRLRN